MLKIYNALLKNIMWYPPVYEKYSFLGNLDFLENPKSYFLELNKFLEEITEQKITTFKEAEIAVKKKILK